jgi:C_GCAxxG_C_C family probable redox protein
VGFLPQPHTPQQIGAASWKEENQMSNVSTATQLFLDGCACSQAILAVYGHPLGLPRNTAMQIAAGFAGGMRLGEICGAVTGAFMVLGLRHASDNCDTIPGRAEVYTRVVQFTERFKRINGTVLCRELLGCDISTPEGLRQAHERNLFKTTCVKIVEDSAKILETLESESRHA